MQDVLGFVLLGWVLDERAGLFNWIWFRWPIPSTLIDESSSIGIQFTVVGFFIIFQDFGSFDDLLLAQPPDVPWLRLRDVAPVRDLRLFSMIRSFVSFQRPCWFFFFFFWEALFD